MSYQQAEDEAEEPRWEQLPTCEKGVCRPEEPSGSQCGEPATRRVSWDGGRDWLHLCDHHAGEVRQKEVDARE